MKSKSNEFSAHARLTFTWVASIKRNTRAWVPSSGTVRGGWQLVLSTGIAPSSLPPPPQQCGWSELHRWPLACYICRLKPVAGTCTYMRPCYGKWQTEQLSALITTRRNGPRHYKRSVHNDRVETWAEMRVIISREKKNWEASYHLTARRWRYTVNYEVQTQITESPSSSRSDPFCVQPALDRQSKPPINLYIR